MRRVLQCNVRHGLQAALEYQLPINAILPDGIILQCSEKAYGDWHERTETIKRNWRVRWTIEQWDELGYEIKRLWHGPFGKLYPVKKEKESEEERS